MALRLKLVDHRKMDGAARLEALADLLDRVADDDQARKSFNMAAWYGEEHAHPPIARMRPRCGTAACALGWATAIFKPLTFSSDKSMALGGDASMLGSEVAEEFFSISEEVANSLFYQGFTRTPSQKATQLRNVAKRWRKGFGRGPASPFSVG